MSLLMRLFFTLLAAGAGVGGYFLALQQGLTVPQAVGLGAAGFAAFVILQQIFDAHATAAKAEELEHRLESLAKDVSSLRSDQAQHNDPEKSQAVVAELRLLQTLLSRFLETKSADLSSAPALRVTGVRERSPAAESVDVASEAALDDDMLDIEHDTDTGVDGEDIWSDIAPMPGGEPHLSPPPEPTASPPVPRPKKVTPKAPPGSRPIRIIKKDSELLQVVQYGLSENRVDLYLQPTVVLPSRKIVHFECYSRVRDEEGRIILPKQYMPVAEQKGLSGTIDNLLLFRLIQLIRRLGPRRSNTRFFCNLLPASINDEEFFSQFLDYMRSSKEFSDRIVFEIRQKDYDALTPEHLDQLSLLGRDGFYFCMDRAVDIFDESELADWSARNFGYVKVEASDLRDMAAAETLGDVIQSFKRHKIHLIASRIEDEEDVLLALDNGVELAQGYQIAMPQSLEQLEDEL